MAANLDQLPAVVKTITREQLNRYARASGDANPLHLDAEFAAATQFGGIIAHGMLTLAFISEMMVAAFGKKWLESGSLKVRFKGAAYLGGEVETWGTIDQKTVHDGRQLIVCSVGVRDRNTRQEIISGAATVKV